MILEDLEWFMVKKSINNYYKNKKNKLKVWSILNIIKKYKELFKYKSNFIKLINQYNKTYNMLIKILQFNYKNYKIKLINQHI